MEEAFYSPEAEICVIGGLLMDPDAATKAIPQLRSEDFYEVRHQTIYRATVALHSRGDVVDVVTLAEELKARGEIEPAGGHSYLADLLDAVPTAANIQYHVDIVRRKSRARSLREYCEKTVDYLEGGDYSDGGYALAERLTSRVLRLYADEGVAAHEDRAEILDRLFQDAFEDTKGGIPLPWSNLNEQIGPLVEGEIVGISAYSGQGKTTLAANLFCGWGRMGVPQIVFSTEMGARWLARAAAADSLTSQKAAEKNLWGEKDLLRAQYQRALQRMKAWEFEVITTPNVSSREIVRRVKVLRQRWPGRPVVVLIDHLHRLDYGREDANKMVGKATKLLKDTAMADEDGGLVVVALYQPRKPPDLEFLHRPVAAHQIRGDSQVWNELDIHISPFRSYVKTTTGYTEWGSPKTALRPDGGPRVVDPPKYGTEEEGKKLSDEHVFISIDKRRIGGSGGFIHLDFHQPSGRISEGDAREENGKQLNLNSQENVA